MSDSAPKPPEEWRNFTTHFPITACRLKHDGLKRLYQIINEKQKEYRDKIVSGLFQTPEETPATFLERKQRVMDAFVTSVTITATNGELLTGNNERIFDDINFPASLKSVFYSTQSVPNAVLKHLPQDRITVFWTSLSRQYWTLADCRRFLHQTKAISKLRLTVSHGLRRQKRN